MGDNTLTRIDVRVIAATHRNLKAELRTGRFREDLFYRLHIFPVRMPSLNERREDIPLLAAHFLDKHAQAFKRTLKGLTPEALRVLSSYRWPGNVRELENAIERAVAVAAGPEVDARDLPAELRENQTDSVPIEALVKLPYKDALEVARDRFSRDYLLALMREFEGNVTRATERAGVERESLHRLLKRFGVRSDDFKPER